DRTAQSAQGKYEVRGIRIGSREAAYRAGHRKPVDKGQAEIMRFRKTGRLMKATVPQAFQPAADVAPGSSRLLMNTSVILPQAEKPAARWRRILASVPVLLTLVSCASAQPATVSLQSLLDTGKYAEAEQAANTALSAQSQDVRARLALGEVCAVTGRYRQA